MRWTIKQVGGDRWQVLCNGAPVGTMHRNYEQAVAGLVASASPAFIASGGTFRAMTAAGGADAGLLPETWESIEGIVFSEETGDGRDFTACTWTWRDPNVSLLPLMLQTSTEMGHFGAELAGFFTDIAQVDGTVSAAGRFYDSEVGIQFRDLLQGSGRFGVSADPGSVDAEWSCVEEDDEGWCIEAKVDFHAYQIIGVTGTPFPGFERAAIQLAGAANTEADDTEADAAADPGEEMAFAAAGAPGQHVLEHIPTRPPRAWLSRPEPEWGDPLLVEQLDEYGQPSGHFAVPLTITDEGEVFGHMFYRGQCHTGFLDVGSDGMFSCVEPPSSPSGYAQFNLLPLTCDDGSTVLTGPLVVGCDHADLRLFAEEARDHYAHNGLSWADVHVIEGQYGAWFCGALRPGVTEEQLRVLRVSAVSGDWRPFPAGLEMMLGLTVNGPGFGIRGREQEVALAAAGMSMIASAQPRVRERDGAPVAMVATNVVRPSCPDCAARALARKGRADLGIDGGDEVRDILRTLERRTRHLIPAEVAHVRARISRN